MRLCGRGLVDSGRKLVFRFDGRVFHGYQGDTLASALMGAGEKLLARSFKYHRPRGVIGAGSQDPGVLVDVGGVPNMRATVQELFDGLEARPQNAWPSLRHDLLSLNDALAPFFSAGFYYKTFMWPRAFWEKLYEPAIRRAAGLGALRGAPYAGEYEKAFAHCDLLVIGAGPAGLMAALTAGRAGADVILADEDFLPGGQLNGAREEVGGLAGHAWAAQVVRELEAMDNVRLMRRTTVTGAYDQGTYGALERVSLHLPLGEAPRECFWRIVAKRAILAAGALERPIAFAGNDRPGVMLAGALGTHLNRFAVVPGARVAVFGNNDGAHRVARDLMRAGLEVVALVDTRAGASHELDVPSYPGAQVTATRGRKGLREITVSHAGGRARLAVDALAVSGGWNPNVALTCHMNGRPEWNPAIHAFVPRPGAVPGLEAAGAALGVFTTKGALKSGRFRAKRALEDLGFQVPSVPLPEAEDGAFEIAPFWVVEGKKRAWLDYQNDVTVKDVRQAARENFRSVEHMKRYTTQGMAPDQGRSSNVNALAVLADATGRSIEQTGTTTFRAPYNPVSLAAIGAGARGKGFRPERFTTSHEAARAAGAPFVEAGLWYRPSWFPSPGETHWRQSCDREVAMVRSSVGVADVSTLGKIDIQGRDAARLLDFVYTNTFSTLKPGRVRYGLMLREDGFVMDDGTTARLGDEHFLMTTTTAAAGEVMAHLEFVHQVIHPDWDVHMISVTEQWAQFAVAGPGARALVAALVADFDPVDWPFMACGAARIAGVDGRLFRISFSGEEGYELAVPARYGEGLWRLLLSQAGARGGGAYGMEALNVLRIEKGFITHAEISGRVTAGDLGLGRMLSTKKDFVGRAAAGRPGLVEAGREQLVGLRPAGAARQIIAGAHLFAQGADAVAANSAGHVTSACYSPTLGASLGLGMLADGRARLGEKVRMVDHLRGVETLCEVCDPVAYDHEGGRMRG